MPKPEAESIAPHGSFQTACLCQAESLPKPRAPSCPPDPPGPAGPLTCWPWAEAAPGGPSAEPAAGPGPAPGGSAGGGMARLPANRPVHAAPDGTQPAQHPCARAAVRRSSFKPRHRDSSSGPGNARMSDTDSNSGARQREPVHVVDGTQLPGTRWRGR